MSARITTKERMKISRQAMPEQDAAARAANFLEVNLGLPERLALLDSLSAQASAKAAKGPAAAHSQDFLYNDDGLPE